MLCAVSTIPSSAAPSASGLTEDMAGLALSTNRSAGMSVDEQHGALGTPYSSPKAEISHTKLDKLQEQLATLRTDVERLKAVLLERERLVQAKEKENQRLMLILEGKDDHIQRTMTLLEGKDHQITHSMTLLEHALKGTKKD
ncbi:uncharacterized protein JCM10292_003526 [Rhodotorula paludigena]|uniref:uncharacterized protein n=1 Tax=Rhodotorula paludigena TaxID=86838 RepID=UPI0031786114